MKPVSLHMEAFGPYATVAEVDFEPLADVGLFVVSGPTGAGKSTIFDAICFALYGSLSGARQGHVDVRSHYADPSAECVVRFVFDANGHRWRVTRQPSQIRQKRRGSGTTERPADALLERWTAAGWEADSAKVRDVTARCRDLVGLSLEQFERVVLLPQGKFAEVLNARTSERADLLRTLFGSEVFDRAAEVLIEQARDGERSLEGAAEQRERFHRRAVDALDRAEADIEELPADVARALAATRAERGSAQQLDDSPAEDSRAVVSTTVEPAVAQLSLLDETPVTDDVVEDEIEPELASGPAADDPARRLAVLQLDILPALHDTVGDYRRSATSARSHLERAESQRKALEQRRAALVELEVLDARAAEMDTRAVRVRDARRVVGLRDAIDHRDQLVTAVDRGRTEIDQVWRAIDESSRRLLPGRPPQLPPATPDAISSLLEQTAARTSAIEALHAEQARLEGQRVELQALADRRAALEATAGEVDEHLVEITAERDALTVEAADLAPTAADRPATELKAREVDRHVATRRTADDLATRIADLDRSRVERSAEAAAARQAIEAAVTELALMDEQLATRARCDAALESATRRRERRSAVERLGAQLVQATETAAARQREADAAFAAFVAGTAPRLAADLADGEPCPVCGSHEHPAPAGDAGEPSLVDVDAVERASAAASSALMIKSDHQAALASLVADDPSLADSDPAELEFDVVSAAEALTVLDQVASDRRRIGAGVEALEKELTAIEASVGAIEADRARAKEQLSGCLGELGPRADRTLAELTVDAAQRHAELDAAVLAVQRRSAIQHRLTEIAAEVKDLDRSKHEVAVELATATERVEQISAAIRRADAQRDHAADGTDLVALAAQLGDLRAALLRAQQLCTDTTTGEASLDAARRAVTALLDGGPFTDEAAALAAAMTPEDLADAERTHTEWRDRRMSVAATIEALDAQGLPDDLPDIEELRADAIEADTRLRVAVDAQSVIGQRVHQAATDIDEIAAIDDATAEQRAHHEVVRRVAAVVRGNNSRRLSLENWVLSVYLQDVVEHANLHLHTMSNGRYRLIVQDAPSNQVGQHGLDLVVDDAHTGRVRPSVSLSGGETFQASLALALGLADVVMVGRAGLHLDALFVDEGFGSLDADAVDQAITVLDGLRSRGSMVGVITHVEALKSALPVAIEVHPRSDHRGSEIRQVA